MPTTHRWTPRLRAGFTRPCATSAARTCRTTPPLGETGTAAQGVEARFRSRLLLFRCKESPHDALLHQALSESRGRRHFAAWRVRLRGIRRNVLPLNPEAQPASSRPGACWLPLVGTVDRPGPYG